MPKVAIVALVVGLIAGLLVGGFHNWFTVPVIERAIILEEQRAAAEARAAGTPLTEEKPLVSLGAQRGGMVVGAALFGAIFGLVFSGGYALLRRVAPRWPPLALALTTAALGMWALSLFPFIKWPQNPPGIGEVSTLTFRQGFSVLFIFLSAVAVVALLLGVRRINSAVSSLSHRARLYGLAALAYGAFAAIISLALPGNPDPILVPIDLLHLYRTLTMIGHFLLWTFLALGVGLTIMWYQRAPQRQAASGQRSTVSGQPSPNSQG